jgi:RNA polymerase sigma-70 factor (ECF subfamily)
MITQLNDEKVMDLLSKGNKAAAGILYDRYYRKIYGYFIRMTRDPEVARDLTQNVFLKVIRYNHNWKGDKVFQFWLFRIARNVLVDYYRGEKKFFDLRDDSELAGYDYQASVQADTTRESCEMLFDAMSRLPAGYRELIELNRFQGFSYKEIADIISSNENAVRVKMCRAIQKLKEIYHQNV